jgi:hypothetical protein
VKPKIFQGKNQKWKDTAMPVGVEELNQDQSDFVPLRSEVEGRAYAIYLKRGSQVGYDVQDWLVAEAQLQAELNCIPVGGEQ